MTEPEGRSLEVHLIQFGRFLRKQGFLVGPQEQQEAFAALQWVGFNQLQLFREALASVFCKSQTQQLQFPNLFTEFWRELFQAFDSKVKTIEVVHPPKPQLQALKSWLYQNQGEAAGVQDEIVLNSSNRAAKSLPDYQHQQIEELTRLLRKFTRDWATRPSRRFVPLNKNGRLDLRKTIRKNTVELIDLMHQQRKERKMDLVVIADSSRSMELFSAFTVQLLYAFQQSYRRLETFAFGTQLFRVTPWMSEHTFAKAMEMLNQQAPEWSGGTKIGASLAHFIDAYGSQLLSKNCLLLIISDGWETGEIEDLEWSMRYLQRRVKKLIWLNPHASKPGYEPLVAGMKSALPYIDIFQGVHDLETFRSWQQQRYQSL